MKKVALTMELDAGSRDKMFLIQDLSNSLDTYFKEKYYGEGIQYFYIGCVFIKLPVGYEEWFKKWKPKYKESQSIKKLDGSSSEIKGVFSYDIKIDGAEYDLFVNGTEKENRKYFATEILKSLSNLDAIPKKVKDFDKEKFKADMELFFKEQKII